MSLAGRSAGIVLAGTLLTGSLGADLITPRQGAPFRGTVISADEKSVTVKTESETRVISRSAIKKIEFGDVLLTGTQGREYVNAEYGVRVTAPAGWIIALPQAGADFAASKQGCSFLLNGLPMGPGVDLDVLVPGALGGMRATVPDARFGEVETARWSGRDARKVGLHAPTAEGSVVFPRHETSLLMVMLICPTERSKSVPTFLADWEKTFQFVDGNR